MRKESQAEKETMQQSTSQNPSQQQQQQQLEQQASKQYVQQDDYQEWLQYKEEFFKWKEYQLQEVEYRSVLGSYQEVLESERMVAMQWQSDFIQSETSFYNTLESIQKQLQNIKEECDDETEGASDINLVRNLSSQSKHSIDAGADVLSPQQQFAQTTIKQLQVEFEREAGMMNDDVGFIREVATGQEYAPDMNLTQELVQLKKRFEAWKEHFKYKLRDARDIIVAQSQSQQQVQETQPVQRKRRSLFGGGRR
eukprot:TRINITY_DN3223_c0_g2_i2.p1 TRINITY_DN3223_c0_g2~~TRINITY_DN3223_c0_g2_i2.p1  ORF type:complete len:253 (+),score=39.18 TRINITY_DN3223_c0_g2_i2:197-955(+)